ncbi:MAG: c-type cytochrome, partial [Proteobacteria bacterium]|nr:c-type cytochrome [Pseudomonadota bacterium]
AKEVEAVGQQWHWTFRLPGEDGEFGSVDATLVKDDNPFGMNPEDPKGQDDVLIENGEVHLLVNTPVKMLLRSKDVLHDFAVAQFRVKMDLVPGLVTFLWVEPTVPGRYEILCEELCGIGHHAMRGMVVVDEQADYNKWLEQQPTYAEVQAIAAADAMAGAANYAVCTACHGAQGEGNPILNAPKIAGQEAWYTKRQIANYKSGKRGAHSDDLYGQQMAPMAATLFNDAAVNNVAAYIETLPDMEADVTVTGDVANGERIWRNCAVCHGERGEGIQAMNAPRQAGMDDWYLARQLRNFKNEIRGSHGQDLYGQQMVRMSNILITDQAVDDVVAYINTL